MYVQSKRNMVVIYKRKKKWQTELPNIIVNCT